jgi:hypothetical protein
MDMVNVPRLKEYVNIVIAVWAWFMHHTAIHETDIIRDYPTPKNVKNVRQIMVSFHIFVGMSKISLK